MKRSKFSLSNYRLTTGYQGILMPIGLTEVLPGDTIQLNSNALVRMSPLVAPVMHPVHIRIHHWFVPHRLVWDKWEDFITGGPDGMDASVFPTVSLTPTDRSDSQLAQYYGIPYAANGGSDPNLVTSALPFRGHNLIWNEWYRDQDLQTELPNSTASGADTTSNRLLTRVAWEKDYFTTARPWEQKGPSVTVPVYSDGNNIRLTFPSAANRELVGNTSGNMQYSGAVLPGTQAAKFGDPSGLEVHTLDIREAFAIQRYEEARARYGSRYTEYLRYLGVKSSDARLQRPEYLGGGRQTIQFSEVLQTAPGDGSAEDVVGALKGHGIAAMRSNRFRRFFEEHGYIHSFMSVQPKTVYMTGIPRTLNRRTKEDFFQKELQFIGQQAIEKKELHYLGDDTAWGYQDRYEEYRRGQSTVSGRFASSQDYWHMARKFTSVPTLNDSFVRSIPTDRIYADLTEPDFQAMINHSIQARRIVAPSAAKSFAY